jgi:hypothetical protein
MDYYKPMQHLRKVNNNTEINSTFYVLLNKNETLRYGRKVEAPGHVTFQYYIDVDTADRTVYDFTDVNVVDYAANFLITIVVRDSGGNIKGTVTNNSGNAE